ncbi:MAG: peptidoglycan DD-metalloendopeptidase family protein [Candidatus Margulisbacteria bacterium]|jgi:RHS repeat-associated protein|nr:peptidoglycan DD-metalloendopeptidase family protein [Candidatus Margulisiibacteriota bacterium]
MLRKLLAAIFILLVQISLSACEERWIEQFVKETLGLPEEQIDIALVKLTLEKEIDPAVDVNYYMTELDKMVETINKMLPRDSTSMEKLNMLKKYLYQKGSWNNYQSYTYDLEDLAGQKLSHQLLSDYMQTRSGNCVSMPFLFLVLGERLGLQVKLAKAELHDFIKYTDEQTGKTMNIETTNGGSINRDIFYIEQDNMSVQAIENGIYLRGLNKKETVGVIVMTIYPFFMEEKNYLAAMRMCNIALECNPKDVYAMVKKGTTYAHVFQGQLERKGYTKDNIKQKITQEDKIYFDRLLRSNYYWFAQAEALGWKERPLAPYDEESVQEELLRRELNIVNVYYYDQQPARFMGRDRVRLEDDPENYFGVNPYVFVRNNPLRYMDPDGKLDVPYNVDNGVLNPRGFSPTPVQHPIFGTMRPHLGKDINGGPFIRARGDGVVAKVDTQRDNAGNVVGWGNYVEIDFGNGLKTRDAHIANSMFEIPDVYVYEGQQVKEGDIIGRLGQTGSATGPHDHHEVLRNGIQVDPLDAANRIGKYSTLIDIQTGVQMVPIENIKNN